MYYFRHLKIKKGFRVNEGETLKDTNHRSYKIISER